MTDEKTAVPTCREVVEHLEDWSEGRLPEADRAPFATHLHLCPPCAHIASEYRALSRVAREALAAEMPEEAKARLRRALAARFRGGGYPRG
jgi:anti-sigma factor RsiW